MYEGNLKRLCLQILYPHMKEEKTLSMLKIGKKYYDSPDILRDKRIHKYFFSSSGYVEIPGIEISAYSVVLSSLSLLSFLGV